jgi:hypothetical protein
MKTAIAPNQFSDVPRELADVLQDLDDRSMEALDLLQQAPAHSSAVHPEHSRLHGLLNALADLRVALKLAS